MAGQLDNEQFCRNLVDVQRGLYAYIVRLVPNHLDANDVLQKTNLVLLSKQQEFRAEGNFNAWAAGVARNQALAFCRDARRDRLVFSEDIVGKIADRGLERIGESDLMFEAMELCREKLGEADRQLLDYRYNDSLSVGSIAESLGRTPHAVSQALYRIRTTLLECIRRTLGSQEGNDAGK